MTDVDNMSADELMHAAPQLTRAVSGAQSPLRYTADQGKAPRDAGATEPVDDNNGVSDENAKDEPEEGEDQGEAHQTVRQRQTQERRRREMHGKTMPDVIRQRTGNERLWFSTKYLRDKAGMIFSVDGKQDMVVRFNAHVGFNVLVLRGIHAPDSVDEETTRLQVSALEAFKVFVAGFVALRPRAFTMQVPFDTMTAYKAFIDVVSGYQPFNNPISKMRIVGEDDIDGTTYVTFKATVRRDAVTTVTYTLMITRESDSRVLLLKHPHVSDGGDVQYTLVVPSMALPEGVGETTHITSILGQVLEIDEDKLREESNKNFSVDLVKRVLSHYPLLNIYSHEVPHEQLVMEVRVEGDVQVVESMPEEQCVWLNPGDVRAIMTEEQLEAVQVDPVDPASVDDAIRQHPIQPHAKLALLSVHKFRQEERNGDDA